MAPPVIDAVPLVPPTVVRPRAAESEEYEVVWSGRDSLIPDRDSRVSQLAGGEFSSVGRRNGART